MPNLCLKLEEKEKDLILGKSLLYEKAVSTLSHLCSLLPLKDSIPKLQMGKLRLTELGGLAKIQSYCKPKPKTGNAIPLWTSWKSLNQCH